ncbi:hypothetical protein [Nocardia caishijiensis]|uniref:Uncharacterized protein n=1 Tax=Nocardia caishijiensis TaxID=184756 RepID=A0ABQ6YS40_9NOCA|nr:hypothetical protein [Nocardia caishijiensis]KAF0848251.1 hypothetical protein FNL39_102399 [Nocardia caishijiensis]
MSFPGATPPPGADPLDPTVLELLRGSSLAPMLDMPVNDVLGSMGLPALPQLPEFVQLPELPPLPTIDLSALMRPLTDLASAFGTGQLGTNSTGDSTGTTTDPTEMLSNVSTVMQTVMSLGSTAIQTVMSVWQGIAAMEAAQKASEAQTDAGKLAAQSTQEKAVLANGAVSVATGAGLMSVVIAKFSATMAMAPLLMGSGAGAAFLVASAASSTAEALAITAKTKTELVGHSASMTAAGEKVPITNAPTGVNSTEQLTQLMSMITPLMSTATTVAQSLGELAAANTSLTAPKTTTEGDTTAARETVDGAEAGGAGGGGIGGGAGGAVGAIAAASAPLSPFPNTRSVGGALSTLPGAMGAAAASTTSAAAVTSGGSAATGTGAMPMGGPMGAGLARDGESSTDDAVRGQLVTGSHGDEVIGQIEGVSLPVVGAADTSTSEAPPDKELTL